MLTRIDTYRLSLPLTTPYHLAFGDVIALDTILVVMHDDRGGEGYGDATVLTGYTDETIEASWPLASAFAHRLVGLDLAAAKAEALALAPRAPFVATAFASAVEMLESAPSCALSTTSPYRCSAINDTEPDAMRVQIDRLCAAGYRTLKIKVGSAASSRCLASARRWVRLAAPHCAWDANRYTPAQATFRQRRSGRRHALEPRAAGDWAAHGRGAALPVAVDARRVDFTTRPSTKAPRSPLRQSR
jgi:L-alanine-DL-glutamate epimerase-like enolase superfamily enzyme